MPSTTIRPASTDDLAAIVDLWVELVRDQQSYGTRLRAEANRLVARQWTAELIADDQVTVAIADGNVVGFVSYEVERDRFNRGVSTARIHNLMVTAEYRGDGLGTALLAAAEEALEGHEVDRVRLETMVDNGAAKEFYEHRGYAPHRLVLTKEIS